MSRLLVLLILHFVSGSGSAVRCLPAAAGLSKLKYENEINLGKKKTWLAANTQ